jgi:hypothetical protein
MHNKSTYDLIDKALQTSLTPALKEQLRDKAITVDRESLEKKEVELMLRENEVCSTIKKIDSTLRNFESKNIMAAFISALDPLDMARDVTLWSPGLNDENEAKICTRLFYQAKKDRSILSHTIMVFRKELKKRVSEPLPNSSKENFFTLLPELVLNILAFLSLKDLAQLSRTCRDVDALLDSDSTKKSLAKCLPKSHSNKLSENFADLSIRAFLNWLRIAKLCNKHRTSFDFSKILYQPEKFADYLSLSATIATDSRQPEYQLKLAVLCHNENAAAAALKIIEWDAHSVCLASAFDSWNILENYFLNDYEFVTEIIWGAIASGKSEIFEYATRHWAIPRYFPLDKSRLICTAAYFGNEKMFDQVISFLDSHSHITMETLEEAAHSGKLNMFLKVFNHPQKQSGFAITQNCLDMAAKSRNIEMVNFILGLIPKENTEIRIGLTTLNHAIRSGYPDIIDAIIDHPLCSIDLRLSQEDLDTAASTGHVAVFKKSTTTTREIQMSKFNKVPYCRR